MIIAKLTWDRPDLDPDSDEEWETVVARLDDSGVWSCETDPTWEAMLNYRYNPQLAPWSGPAQGAFGRLAANWAAKHFGADVEFADAPPGEPDTVY